MELLPSDWSRVFALETPIIELMLRAIVLYTAILAFLRLMPRRSGGELATMDLIFALLIAQAAAPAMGDFTSLGDGLILIATIMGWNYLINALSYRIPLLEWLVSAPPLQIIRHGQLLRRNMRSEFLTEEELLSYLRQKGIDDVSQVKTAHIESEGKISVVRNTD